MSKEKITFRCKSGCDNGCVVTMDRESHSNIPTMCLYNGKSDGWEEVKEDVESINEEVFEKIAIRLIEKADFIDAIRKAVDSIEETPEPKVGDLVVGWNDEESYNIGILSQIDRDDMPYGINGDYFEACQKISRDATVKEILEIVFK